MGTMAFVIPRSSYYSVTEGTMTTIIVEKKPVDVLKKEEPFAELDPFVPEFMGGLLTDVRPFAEDFDPFFEGFGLKRRTAGPAMFRTPPATRWTPNLEMLYADQAIVVRAELPGINKEEVKVEIVDGALTIEGERKYEKEVTTKGYFTTERAYGTFYRRIPLPEEAKVGEAKATFKDGVLEVTIPAPALEKEPVRRLEITGA
jgi:HSP20 family protein